MAARAAGAALLVATLAAGTTCAREAAPERVLHDLAVELPVLATSGPAISALRVAGAGDALRLPAGAALTALLDAEGDAWFTHQGWRSTAGARLEILCALEGAGETTLASGAGPVPSGELPLPGRGRRLIRLRLRATGESPGEIFLLRPRVVGPTMGDAPLPAAVTARSATTARPNVLVFLVDTLRRDRLGVYGSPRALTPRVDAFAAGATVFEHAVAQASWTRPAVTSIFTGLYPPSHGVTRLDTALAQEATTLAEHFSHAGYFTAAVSTNWHVTAQTGLRQGFQRFTLTPDASAAEVARSGLDLLTSRAPGDRRPYLLYLHILDPHAPYAPPPDLRQRFAPTVRPLAGTLRDLARVYASRGRRRAERLAEIAALYDGEVAGVDRAFGALLDELEARGLLRDTLVVLVADHGEEIGEHGGLGHGNSLHAELLDIPLVLRFPGQARGARRTDVAQQVDLLPTLLAAARIAVPPHLPGRDLATPLAGERAAFSHLHYEGKEREAVELGGYKLVLAKDAAGAPLLYDRGADPGELRDVAAERPLRAAFLLQHLRAFELGTRGGLDPAPAALPDEGVRALRALGYL
jgi:arylsulfatase A-like enzyme